MLDAFALGALTQLSLVHHCRQIDGSSIRPLFHHSRDRPPNSARDPPSPKQLREHEGEQGFARYQDSFKTAWESLLLRANGHDPTRARRGARVDREKLRQIDLHWHDLRH